MGGGQLFRFVELTEVEEWTNSRILNRKKHFDPLVIFLISSGLEVNR